jgi:hypothetical protein
MIPRLINRIIDYENGKLDEDETVSLFQELVDDRLAWQLQGSYGRTAQNLIDAGLVTQEAARPGKKGKTA